MTITIYHTTNCAFCKTEMQWLDSKDVKYDHINIDENKDALEYVINETNSQAVPVTVIKDGDTTHFVRGFDRKRLTEVLKLDN